MFKLLFILFIVFLFVYYYLRYGRSAFFSNTGNQNESLKNVFGSQDLTKINIQQAYNELIRYVNTPEPLTHWGRERKQQQIYYYIDKINSLKALGLDIEQFNADILTHTDRLNNLVAEEKHNLNMMDIDRQSDIQYTKYNSKLSKKEFEKEMDEFKFYKKNKKLDLKERMADIYRKIKETEIILSKEDREIIKENAYLNMMGAKTKRESALADFIYETLKVVDIKEFDQNLQSYIIASVFNPGGTQYDDLNMSDRIKQAIEDQEVANARKKKAESRQEQYKADAMKEKIERDRRRRERGR